MPAESTIRAESHFYPSTRSHFFMSPFAFQVYFVALAEAVLIKSIHIIIQMCSVLHVLCPPERPDLTCSAVFLMSSTVHPLAV